METMHEPMRPRGTDELRETAQHLQQDVRGLGTAARHVAEDSLADAGRQAACYARKGREQMNQLCSSTEEWIVRRPFTALGIAAGVGLLIGACLVRRA
jgi:ElaB/YqjD/DUF883 family membrane-anchored ribosome-binding protein